MLKIIKIVIQIFKIIFINIIIDFYYNKLIIYVKYTVFN